MPTIRPTARAFGSIGAILLLGACDIPTELPKWDMTYRIQAEGSAMGVGEVLPAKVTLTGNGLAFLVSLDPDVDTETLFDLCVTCRTLNGQFAPKPAFNGDLTTTTELPEDLVSAALTSGTLNLTVQNGFSFDPLRPSTSARGTITITVRSGAVVLGTAIVRGTNTTLVPGATLPVPVTLMSGSVTGPLVATINVDSPAGDAAQINTAQTLVATATATNIIASSGRVIVQNKTVAAEENTFDLTGVDDAIANNARSGALLLSVVNPFSIAGNLTLTLTGGERTITKTVALTSAPTSIVEVPLDESELDAILQHDVVMKVSGPVSAAASVSVTPAQALTFTSELKLILGPEA